MHYYSIEWHTHTTHSDADQTIDQLFAAAAAAHYDILSISDHNTLSAYAEIQQRQLQPASWLLRNSLEWTTYYGHMLVLGTQDVVNWYEAKPTDIDQWVQKNRDAGAIVGVAHRFELGSPICTGCHWDFLVRNWDNFDFLEVLNGNSPQEQTYNQKAYALWSQLLKAGHRLTGSAGRDWHRPKKATDNVAVNYLGIPDEISDAAIKASIRQGNFYVSLGPTWQVTLTDAQHRQHFMGETLPQGQYQLDIAILSQSNALSQDFKPAIKEFQLLANETVLRRLPATALEGGRLQTEVALPTGPFRLEARGAFKGQTDQRLIIGNPFYIS